MESLLKRPSKYHDLAGKVISRVEVEFDPVAGEVPFALAFTLFFGDGSKARVSAVPVESDLAGVILS